ncbi:hypothetical protein NIES267_13500 [Calothrix parasitica NIES-267]|uniref:Tic20 family protein n=1 Tax=Calothrix parasitica NIES-267 TaxID=1973488 RepID=A0A1Z4LKV0_9CYAN|nr:hypothetical protein NIES267_13500 [Calothrix parasitica NIES-267]
MTWRGSTNFKDRILACLPYLLPVVAVFAQGSFLMELFPVLGLIYLPLTPLIKVYYGVRYSGLIIFFALLILVVRNERISHFIRFNTMQAIILNIGIFLFGILTDLLSVFSAGAFVMQTLFTIIFVGVLASVVYSIARTVMGHYAEVPVISDAVYAQVR